MNERDEPIRLAAVIVRRKPEREKDLYKRISLQYSPSDYEVLLQHHSSDYRLVAFTAPIGHGDPKETLLSYCNDWTTSLAANAGHGDLSGLKGSRALFLKVISPPTQFNLDHEQNNIFLTYIIPTSYKGSKVVSCYPSNSTDYPSFYSLDSILNGMYYGSLKVCPSTRRMLGALDKWLYSRHHLPLAIRQSFQAFSGKVMKHISNPIHDNDNDSDLYEVSKRCLETEKADKHFTNPLFGTDLKFKDSANIHLVNKHFGMGVPNYEDIIAKHYEQSEALENCVEWIDRFPLHKCACEGDLNGMISYIALGHKVNSLDTDFWSSLHYACWYGHLDIVTCLVNDYKANVNVQNDCGSTPLQFAAGNGHKYIVKCLLECPRINTTLTDNQGRTALDVCIQNKSNHWKSIEKLLRSVNKKLPQQSTKAVRVSLIEMNDDQQLSERIEDINEMLAKRGSLSNMLELDMENPLMDIHTSSVVKKVIVNFVNGHNQLVCFSDGKNTKSMDVLQEVYKTMHLELEYQHVFALWIESKHFAIQLGDNDAPLHFIGKWPDLMEKNSGRKDPSDVPQIVLKRNVFLSKQREISVPDQVVLEFLFYDALHCVINELYPTSEEEAIELATIAMQLKFGDYNPATHNEKFVKNMLPHVTPVGIVKGKTTGKFAKNLLMTYQQQSKREQGPLKLYDRYLQMCRSCPYYGAMFYNGQATIKVSKSAQNNVGIKPAHKLAIRVGINPDGFHLINKDTNNLIETFSFETVSWNTFHHKLFVITTITNNLSINIHTEQALLMNNLATQMKRQLHAQSQA